MKTLSKDQCLEWLASRKLAADPYHSANLPPLHYEQFSLPQHALSASAILRSIIACAEPFQQALLHIIDWPLYDPDEMEILSQIRLVCGEQRWLIETPGHEFTSSERDLLIGLFALVTSYGWSAYAYFDHGLTLFSWEGELLDLWDANDERYRSICNLMRNMGVLTSSKSS